MTERVFGRFQYQGNTSEWLKCNRHQINNVRMTDFSVEETKNNILIGNYYFKKEILTSKHPNHVKLRFLPPTNNLCRHHASDRQHTFLSSLHSV